MAEAGLPGFESMTTFTLFAPAGTPPEVIARLSREVNKALIDEIISEIEAICRPIHSVPRRN
ncbi:MAG: hypothetical protein A3D94_13630 [Alphaproteobacteria bacterium RIFCSPHIGHO2_12_FULL_66_14]|nr:MAG: hypothetical protein A3D94_13630 [Alphaproteobacteria bacterium RIFCSPHIGHO2_12_FULL_66_14]